MIDTAVILCGGRGSRISELTGDMPKPMLLVGGIPIVSHIIRLFREQGINKFILLVGYKKEAIEKFFVGYDDVIVWDTGLDTQTGGRLLRVKDQLPNKFFLTYGDGISTVPIRSVESLHDFSTVNVTLTAVHPVPRFGALTIRDNMVTEFSEKQDHLDGWINGGFMVMNKNVLEYIDGDYTNLEKDVLPILAKKEKVGAYKYNGYWKCCDTMRDLIELNNDYKEGKWK